MVGIAYFIAAAAVALLAACQNIGEDTIPPEAECVTDADCAAAGCSGQLCVPAGEAAGIITTCEYKDEYKCLKLTSCGCSSGACGWADNDEYSACLDRFGKK